MDNKKIVSAISFILVGLILLSFSLFGIIKSAAETPYYRIRFDYESGHAPDIDDVAYYFVLFSEQLTETSIENEEYYEIEFLYYFDDYSYDEWQSPILYISTSSLEVWKDTIGDGDNHEFEEYLVDVDWYLIYEFSSRLSYERVSLPSYVGGYLSITKYTNESSIIIPPVYSPPSVSISVDSITGYLYYTFSDDFDNSKVLSHAILYSTTEFGGDFYQYNSNGNTIVNPVPFNIVGTPLYNSYYVHVEIYYNSPNGVIVLSSNYSPAYQFSDIGYHSFTDVYTSAQTLLSCAKWEAITILVNSFFSLFGLTIGLSYFIRKL